MSDGIQVILRKATALGVSAMMVVTLSAIAVVKVDHKTKTVASCRNAGNSGEVGTGTEGGRRAGAARGKSRRSG